MSVIIRLTDEEISLATEIAIKQDLNCKLKGYKDNHGYGYYSEEYKQKNSKEGLMSEKAVAKYLQLEWPPKNGGFKDADIGVNIQVRSTELPYGSLIIRPDDNPAHKYVLVIRDRIPEFKIVGWILSADARQDMWLRNPNGRPPAWFVPQKALKPMELLK
jgi:hypothetical protein